MNNNTRFEFVAAAFHHATGYLRPGKSEPMGSWYEGRDEESRAAWEYWSGQNAEVIRAFEKAAEDIFGEEAKP